MMPANAPSTPVTKTLAKCLGIEQRSAGRTQTFEALNGALFNESRSAIVIRQWRGVPDRRSENVETFVGGHGGLRRMVDEIVGEELLEDMEIAFALHLFGVPADDSLGGFAGRAVAHCL
jgi:hypothetical protein